MWPQSGSPKILFEKRTCIKPKKKYENSDSKAPDITKNIPYVNVVQNGPCDKNI